MFLQHFPEKSEIQEKERELSYAWIQNDRLLLPPNLFLLEAKHCNLKIKTGIYWLNQQLCFFSHLITGNWRRFKEKSVNYSSSSCQVVMFQFDILFYNINSSSIIQEVQQNGQRLKAVTYFYHFNSIYI